MSERMKLSTCECVHINIRDASRVGEDRKAKWKSDIKLLER